MLFAKVILTCSRMGHRIQRVFHDCQFISKHTFASAPVQAVYNFWGSRGMWPEMLRRWQWSIYPVVPHDGWAAGLG